MDNFYKINHRYNIQNPWVSIPSHPRSAATKFIHALSPKIASFVNKIEDRQPLINKKSSVEASSSSYHAKINQILTNWQQLQKEKKAYQKQFVTEQKEQNEFDEIMEEYLENQLKELERKEEKQYKLIEEVVETQLKQEYQNNPTSYLEENSIEQLKQIQELETIIQENDEQSPKKKPFDQFQKLFNQKQTNMMARDIWKQKHDMYLKQIMNKSNQMKMNKIINLLEICFRTKHYYIKQSKK